MKLRTALLFLAAALMLTAPMAAGAETFEDEDTIVTIIRSPEQVKAERPPCFPDPADHYIQLPDRENLAEGKPVQASQHNDVYVSRNLNDGIVETYWESNGFPAEVTVDLEGRYSISTAAFCLNPSAIWEPRTQEISVSVSTDGENFTEVAAPAVYSFDAETGNRVRIDFDPVEAAYVRVVITSNSSSHSRGAQVAEICIY